MISNESLHQSWEFLNREEFISNTGIKNNLSYNCGGNTLSKYNALCGVTTASISGKGNDQAGNTTIGRIVARETDFFRHHEGFSRTERTSQHCRIQGFKGSPLCRETLVSRTAHKGFPAWGNETKIPHYYHRTVECLLYHH